MYGYEGEGKKDVFRVGNRTDVKETVDKILEVAVPFSRGWPGVPHASYLGKTS